MRLPTIQSTQSNCNSSIAGGCDTGVWQFSQGEFSMDEPNLVPYLSHLTIKEKAVLLRLIRELPNCEHHHAGTLPFISVHTAKGALHLVAKKPGVFASEKWQAFARVANNILSKVNAAPKDEGKVSFLMHLNPKKVYRQFGRSPERGKPLNHLPKEKVTVGVKYHLPSKDYLPDKDVLVAPSVAVKPTGGGMYEVTAPARHLGAVREWLQANCQ